jgi:transcription elongation factor GreA
MSSDHGAAALLREVGLLPDGPVLWGRPLTSRKSGVYLVELAQPAPTPPLDMNRIGKWLEALPELKLDGARPTSRTLLLRLASLWLPGETVLYIGATTGSVGGRVLALAHHELGARRPHADGQWLHALVGVERTRVWWAETDAPEEYLDGLFGAFADGAAARAALPGGLLEARPPGAILVPWANTRRPTGERQAHGLTGAVAPDDAPPPPPPTRVVDVPAGAADGAATEVRGTGTVRRAPRAGSAPAPAARAAASAGRAATPARRVVRAPGSPAPTAAARDAAARAARIEPVPMTREAYARLEAELLQLTRTQRPEVVARIKAAREHGDLKENAEYQAAREEQSFMEGRIRLLEERKRHAVLIEETGTGRVSLGSTVVLEHEGEPITYTIVGTTDADPAAGRISSSSPVGAALLGAVPDQDVEVRTPRGTVRYRVVEVR